MHKEQKKLKNYHKVKIRHIGRLFNKGKPFIKYLQNLFSMYRVAVVLLGITGIFLSLILGYFSVIAWEIAAILIPTSIGISTLLLAFEKPKSETNAKPKVKSDAYVRPKKEAKMQKLGTAKVEKDTLRDETIFVSANAGYYYEFELEKNDHLKGRIISDDPLDIYFVNKTNFQKWEKDREFFIDNCNESVLDAKIDYVASRKGTWYILIENNGRKSAKVKVTLH